MPVGFPMPRDVEQMFDETRRVRVSTRAGTRFPLPVPNGWFIVAESNDLAPGEVRPLHYFDRDLVLFRTQSGEPRLLDAYCVHLGAHLAVGGRVEGDCIRCPFHGFTFDGVSGRCVEIPYAQVSRIPARAAQRAYPTLERNHMIWAWHHAEGAEPFYDVPVVDELDDPDWHPFRVTTFKIGVSCQDMSENTVDSAHFLYVLGQESIPGVVFTTDGTRKRAVGPVGVFVRDGYGLGLGVFRLQGRYTVLSSTTPIDREHLEARWVFTAPRTLDEEEASAAYDNLIAAVSQDIPIWENKIYQHRPVLTRSEGLVMEQRRWARQFYSDLSGLPDEADFLDDQEA